MKTSYNSFSIILSPDPAELEQNQSLSQLPLIAGDTGFIESGQGNRVKELVDKYEKNYAVVPKKGEVPKKNDPKLKKLASEAFGPQSPQSSLNPSLTIGIGSVFEKGAKGSGKEVSL